MRPRFVALMLTLACGLSVLAGYGLRVYAEGAPTLQPVFYAGTLEVDGKLAEGNYNVTLTLVGAADSQQALCTSRSDDTPVEGGRFRVEVSAECVELFKAKPDLWARLKFTNTLSGVTNELPAATKIGAVPYALEAQHAVNASNANAPAGALAATLSTLRKDVDSARQGVAEVVGASAVSVTAAAAISVPALTFVKLDFSKVEWDTLNEYTAANGFTAKNAGIYQVCASAQWSTSVPTELDAFIDGVRFRAFAAATGTCAGCLDVRLNAGQRLQVQAYQLSGGPVTLNAEPLWSYLNIHRVF